jgi:hypothetical protein
VEAQGALQATLGLLQVVPLYLSQICREAAGDVSSAFAQTLQLGVVFDMLHH